MITKGNPIRTIIITSPDQLDQDWIWRLMASNEIQIIGKFGLASSGVDMAQQQLPHLVMVDQGFEHAVATIRQIRAVSPLTICLAVVPEIDIEEMRQLMAAGARDVLPSNVPYSELYESLLDIMTMETERGRPDPAASSLDGLISANGKIIVAIAPKGGVGTTTTAANLAIALHKLEQRPTIIADFSLQFGNVDTHLNLRSKYSIADLADVPDLKKATGISRVILKHESGVDVLLAPQEPDRGIRITAEEVSSILDYLQEKYNFIVIDTWSSLDEVTETLMKRADEILLLMTPELPMLRNAKQFLAFAARHDIPLNRFRLVLNRYPSVEGITLEDIEQNLQQRVQANLPSDGELVLHSINMGVPVVLSHPESWIARNIVKLATTIANGEQLDAEQPRKGTGPLKKGTGPLKKGTGPLRRMIGIEE